MMFNKPSIEFYEELVHLNDKYDKNCWSKPHILCDKNLIFIEKDIDKFGLKRETPFFIASKSPYNMSIAYKVRFSNYQ